MFINHRRKEINLKIVYYGPALSGKTTNLQSIHATADPARCGQLMTLKTEEDRTLLFDYMQIELGLVDDLRPKFNLYTVPGQAQYGITRKAVLRGADGVVFVADSAPDRLRANEQAWQQLHQHLYELHINPAQFPMVIQANKQDVPGATPVETLRTALKSNGHPIVSAVATEVVGVHETLTAIMRASLQHIVRLTDANQAASDQAAVG